jgi:hypothetical protein
LQELLEELHHVPQVIEVTHQSRKSYKTIYVNDAEITGQRLVGIQERIPAEPSVGNQESVPRTSHSVSASLGTAALQQNNNTMDTSLYNPQQRTSGNHIDTLASIAYLPAQVHSQKKQYFEVCINAGNYAVTLNEISLDYVKSDADLFGQILDRYRKTRGYGIRKIFLKPRDVHFVMVRTQTVILITNKNWVASAKPLSQFSVSQAYNDLVSIHEKPSEYPPQEEIDKQRYHYRCPKVLMPAHIFLHFLSRHRGDSGNGHLQDTWLRRLPKKLNTSILDQMQRPARNWSAGSGLVHETEDDFVFGWGVHILEGPNQAGLSLVLALGIAVAFLVSCLVVGIANTEEQGFGVGQFLIAIVTCGMTAVYFALADR